jgi:response regulator RpfG family c-di-GMP phosphodiesterase
MPNILAVQDEGESNVDLKPGLESAGHQVLTAKSVEGAKALLQAASFDLVICGAHLNNGMAFDLLKFVKCDPNVRHIPFLLFCSNPTDLAKSVNESMRSTAMLLGADKYTMQNAFSAEQLRIEIESLLRERTSEADLFQPKK